MRALMSEIGLRARGVAFALVGGLARLIGKPEVEKSLQDQPQAKQRRITAFALLGLFASSLFAAQFGWVGLLVFLLLVVLIIN